MTSQAITKSVHGRNDIDESIALVGATLAQLRANPLSQQQRVELSTDDFGTSISNVFSDAVEHVVLETPDEAA